MPDSGRDPTPRELALRLHELDGRVHLQLQHQNEEIRHATLELESRMKLYNDFRDTLSKQVAGFITTDSFLNMGKRVADLELAKSNLEGRFWAVTAIVVLVELALVVWELMVRR